MYESVDWDDPDSEDIALGRQDQTALLLAEDGSVVIIQRAGLSDDHDCVVLVARENVRQLVLKLLELAGLHDLHLVRRAASGSDEQAEPIQEATSLTKRDATGAARAQRYRAKQRAKRDGRNGERDGERDGGRDVDRDVDRDVVSTSNVLPLKARE